MTKKILTIVGTRPQFIKTALVSKLLRKSTKITEVLVHTGQHYDDNLSKIFFREMELPEPDYNLNTGSGSHGEQTGAMLIMLEKVIMKEKPALVLVYGDTNSTLAGALATVKLGIPLVHVEAGPRSFNRLMPEEINRITTDHLSSLLFAPTAQSALNLYREGIPAARVFYTGDVMYDTFLHYSPRAEQSNILERLGIKKKHYVLVTIHRAENTDNNMCLRYIADALKELSPKFPVIAALHPRTQAALAINEIQLEGNIWTISPPGYLDMNKLEKNARLIITDSGGVQREAFFHRVPCITLRAETEWPETVKCGWTRLLSPGPDLGALLKKEVYCPEQGSPVSGMFFGYGKAVPRIVKRLDEYISGK
ncbi:MAG: UDP-N-acetylglucosamine 2-epimerase (non-hydrolyzing) [Bacillota bacterium]|nr:UDP-N-acetylglucosamine 2-epimerase (non-hydrolyzing) [Bacillota bacterium]